MPMRDNPHAGDYKVIIEFLSAAKEGIATIKNPNIASIINRVSSNLSKDINSLKVQVDQPIDAVKQERVKPQPLRTFMGKVLPPIQERIIEKQQAEVDFKVIKEMAQKQVEDAAVSELREIRDRIYPEFLNMKDEEIRDKYSDLEIQAVAKKAGLPVTEKTRVDLKFIGFVKDAIRKKAEIEKKDAEITKKINEATNKP